MSDDLHITEGFHNAVHQYGAVFQNLADACRADEDRLRELEERPRDVLREHGINVPMGMDVNVALNTRDTFHFTMPPDPNLALEDEALMAVAGGKSAGGMRTASSMSTLPSSVSSAGCASSGRVRDPNRPRYEGGGRD